MFIDKYLLNRKISPSSFFLFRCMFPTLCLRKEADYTLDDSFWNEDSPVGKKKKLYWIIYEKKGWTLILKKLNNFYI